MLESSPRERVAIVGCGYTGSRLADYFVTRNADVRAFGRHVESLPHRSTVGTQWSRLDLDDDVDAKDFDRHLIYYLVPPSTEPGDARLRRFLYSGLRGVPKRLIYMSTTGVYGDAGGALVDEDTPPAPGNERATRRLEAESLTRTWAHAHRVSWCILRVAGIYGPGRLPLERLARRVPVIAHAEAKPANRIHVSDLVTACGLAGVRERADRKIYNVTDGSDDTHTQFMQRVARIAGLPLPPLISRAEAERTLSPLAWSFLAGSRRVDNRRMLSDLGVPLKYRDLDAGIRASLEEV